MSSHPPAPSLRQLHPPREPWPEIDRLSADVAVGRPVGLRRYAGVKVALDYAAALLLLPVALVLVALAAVAVKLTSRGPAFYTQTRLGLNGRRYRLFKIRTMHHNCEAVSGIQWSPSGDKRVTWVGHLLRVTHIDELPQLLNVLKGEMSLVGPRPERPEVIRAKALDRLVPGYKHRLLVRPGVTGLAQLQLPPDTDVAGVRHKVVYDLYYVQNLGLLLDLRLLLATLCKPFLGPNAIRWLFRLPARTKVSAAFRDRVTRPTPTDAAFAGVQAA